MIDFIADTIADMVRGGIQLFLPWFILIGVVVKIGEFLNNNKGVKFEKRQRLGEKQKEKK